MKTRIGIALGSGSARGMAHIGVLKQLAEMDIEPDIVCGCSIGAAIGACYLTNRMDDFSEWVSSLSRSSLLHYMDLKILSNGGMADGGRLIDFLKNEYGDPDIESLHKPYAAVATDLHNGREIWLQQGSVWDAVRASIAIPGLLIPALRDGRWLVDGGLVNPVPVSLCKALGADIIIAVDLNSDLVKMPAIQTEELPAEELPEAAVQDAEPSNEEHSDDFFSRLGNSIKGAAAGLWKSGTKVEAPGALNVMLSSIDIMQDRITNSRLAGEPPDIILTPHLADVGLMDFNRADDAIAEGRESVKRMQSAIEHALS